MLRWLKLKAPKIYRQYEQKLGIAQRANNKKRVKAIHAKIKNIRQNILHQFTYKIVNSCWQCKCQSISTDKISKVCTRCKLDNLKNHAQVQMRECNLRSNASQV